MNTDIPGRERGEPGRGWGVESVKCEDGEWVWLQALGRE